MSDSIDLSIVIVSFNARADLERCIESVYRAPPRAAFETIVVDNASSDGSTESLVRWPGVVVLMNRENVGYARANNAGIRASRGRNLLLLNSDTIVAPGSLDRLLAVLESRPDVAVVGPRLVDADGRAELSFGPMLGPLNEWRQKRLACAQARVEALTRREQVVDWVTGACLLVRRADAESVGLLDERFFMYTEDVDFCASIRARRRQVLFTPSVEIVHLRGRSGAAAPDATALAYRRSRIAFYEKHHPRWTPLLRAWLRLTRKSSLQ